MKLTRFEEERLNTLNLIDYRLNILHALRKGTPDETLEISIFLSHLNKFGIAVEDADVILSTLNERGEIKLINAFTNVELINAIQIGRDQQVERSEYGEKIPLFTLEVNGDFKVISPKEGSLGDSVGSLDGVTFDDKSAQIRFDDRICQLKRNSLHHGVCKAMFTHAVNEPVSWDEIYFEIQGSDPEDPPKNKRQIQDAAAAVSSKIRAMSVNATILSWDNGNVTRNF